MYIIVGQSLDHVDFIICRKYECCIGDITKMDALKRYLTKIFEDFFVLLIILSISAVNYFLLYKLAFLNFYLIPIILAAYYLGQSKSILGAAAFSELE